MSEPLDLAADDGALTPEERAALDRAVAADPVLGEALAQWRLVRAAVARDLDAAAPDGDLLVLYALAGMLPSTLDEKDRARLEALRPSLEANLASHPALA